MTTARRLTLATALSGALLLLPAAAYSQSVPFMQAGLAQPVPPPAKSGAGQAPASVPLASVPPASVPPAAPSAASALWRGTFNLSIRTRFEGVHQSNLAADAEVTTTRSRFGYTTAPVHGFRAMIEGENITILGPEGRFNAAGTNNTPNRPVIADPEVTELNQAWIGYTRPNRLTVKAGRQHIALDNHRFVGDVLWRQNTQTYDAATIVSQPTRELTLSYGYVWGVRRIFGDVAGLAPTSPNRNFEAQSHLMQAVYSGWARARVVSYAYLLGLSNGAGPDNSTATYGAYVAGATPLAALSPRAAVGYRAEFAYQTDYADSRQDYSATYHSAELSATMARASVGAGYERLGTGANGAGPERVGFRTPLSTLHAFNGWADVFLATPADGLRDEYGFAQIITAGIPIRLVYHRFTTARGGADLGHELNLQATRKISTHWSVLLKYADYRRGGATSPPQTRKTWAQGEYSF